MYVSLSFSLFLSLSLSLSLAISLSLSLSLTLSISLYLSVSFSLSLTTSQVGEDRLIRFSGCKSGQACSIILRGASSHLLDEAERSLHDALCVLTETVKETRYETLTRCHHLATSCILYSVFYILYFIFYILYFIFCILYFIFCILYFVFCILYFIFCILLPHTSYIYTQPCAVLCCASTHHIIPFLSFYLRNPFHMTSSLLFCFVLFCFFSNRLNRFIYGFFYFYLLTFSFTLIFFLFMAGFFVAVVV